MKLIFPCLIAILSFVFVVDANCQSNQEDNQWMLWQNSVSRRWLMYHLEKDDVALLKEKWEQIGASLEKAPGEYAGTYFLGDYMSGYFLRWSPTAGYVFVRYFDVEHPCYFSYGRVETKGTKIKFIHQGEASKSICPPGNSGRPEIDWVAALGGEYFIPRREAPKFADFYAGSGEYNGYLRAFDSGIPFAIRWGKNKARTQNFVLPTDLSRLVRPPLTGELVYVGKTITRNRKTFLFDSELETVTPVSIDIGSAHGLKKSQEFVLMTDDDGRAETLIVTRVGKRRSNGIVVRTVWEKKEGYFSYNSEKNDSEMKPFIKLRPGIKISTSPASKL